MKLATLMLGAATMLPIAPVASAQVIISNPSRTGTPGLAGDLAGLAYQVKTDAELLVQVLASQGCGNTYIVFNAGLTAKDANDLVELLTGTLQPGYYPGSLDQVVAALAEEYQQLVSYYTYYGTNNSYIDQYFYQLEGAMSALTMAYSGPLGGGFPGGGTGGFPSGGTGGFPGGATGGLPGGGITGFPGGYPGGNEADDLSRD